MRIAIYALFIMFLAQGCEQQNSNRKTDTAGSGLQRVQTTPEFDLSYLANGQEVVSKTIFYDFEDSSTALFEFPVDNEFAVAPVLTEGGLDLLANARNLTEIDPYNVISEITFPELFVPSNPMIRVKANGSTTANISSPLLFKYDVVTSRNVPDDRIMSSLNEDLPSSYFLSWKPNSRAFDLRFEITKYRDFNLTPIEMEDVVLDSLIVQSYPMTDSDWNTLNYQLTINQYSSCNNPLDKVTGTIDFTVTNGQFAATGILYDDLVQIGTFETDQQTSQHDTILLEGYIDSTWSGIEELLPIEILIDEGSSFRLLTRHQSCYLSATVTHDFLDQADEMLWVDEAVIDFTLANSINDIPMIWTEPDLSRLPVVADYQFGKALLLTPGAIDQNSFYPQDYENYQLASIDLIDMVDSEGILEISLDMFGLPDTNASCESTYFSFELSSEHGTEAINTNFPNQLILSSALRIFVGPHLKNLIATIGAGANDCSADPRHYTYIDDFSTKQYEFNTHPFSGDWVASISTNPSDLCLLEAAESAVQLSDSLEAFDVTFGNGATLTAQLTPAGLFSGTFNSTGHIFNFTEQLFEAEIVRAFSQGENGCPYFLYLHRPHT